jgi:hypothetical protein
MERDGRGRAGVDPSKLALNCSCQFYMWHCHIGTLVLNVTLGGFVPIALIKTVLHKTVTCVVVKSGSDVFRSLGVTLLAQMVELARRCPEYT